MAAVTITGNNRAANLDLCLTLTAFSSEGSFTCHTVFKIKFGRPVIVTSECRAAGEGAVTTYIKRFGFDGAGTNRAGTHDLPDAKREHYH
jgi:hypothetical protein